jgi:hypothetical protein
MVSQLASSLLIRIRYENQGQQPIANSHFRLPLI